LKKPSYSDPNAEREAANYDNPIPSRELILELLEQSSGPLSLPAVCESFDLHSDDNIEAMRRRLIAMERDGQLISNRKREYGRVDKMDLVRGRVQGHRDGFGFVIPFDGSDDIYLSNRQMRKAFDGDEVLARPGPVHKGKREGAIIEVLTHHTQQVVGRYICEHGNHFVVPDNPRITQDILLDAGTLQGAKTGQFVVVTITQQPGRRGKALGEVAEVLGEHLAPGMEIDVAIRSHSIPHVWPADVETEVQGLGEDVLESHKQGRIDSRHLSFVTIDGEDARDFDDAVYCESSKHGWTLYVAIADVSNYVHPHSALDKEAIVRGNSVYFPDFVIPMLPEVLSNGLCSLNPKVDRLCMVCEMQIDVNGVVTAHQFYESVMHSRARLTYTEVGKVIQERDEKDSEIRKSLREVTAHLDELHDLYGCLVKARRKRGAIEFESNETRIIFDDQRKIESIIPTVRNDAHKLIEECMLAANVCAAKFLQKHELPCLYRVHETPKEEKLVLLQEFLKEFGFTLPTIDKVTPKHYRDILLKIEGRPNAHVIQTVMLRSMNQAVYQGENLGHFGLAYDAYGHFTSPIRRYPDLLVHRAIRSVIRSQRESAHVKRHENAKAIRSTDIYPYNDSDISSMGEQFSSTERRADEATRDVVNWLKCEYLNEHVGDIFEGVVSSVVGFGLFVELNDMYVEGLVHITSLPGDYYHHEAAHHRLVGERTRLTFHLGDTVSVKVVRVSLDDRKIDFELVGEKIESAAKHSKRKPKKTSSSKKRKTKSNDRRSDDKNTAGKGPGDRTSVNKKSASKNKKPEFKKSEFKKTKKNKNSSIENDVPRKPRKRKSSSEKNKQERSKHEKLHSSLNKKVSTPVEGKTSEGANAKNNSSEKAKESSNPLIKIVKKIGKAFKK